MDRLFNFLNQTGCSAGKKVCISTFLIQCSLIVQPGARKFSLKVSYNPMHNALTILYNAVRFFINNFFRGRFEYLYS